MYNMPNLKIQNTSHGMVTITFMSNQDHFLNLLFSEKPRQLTAEFTFITAEKVIEIFSVGK